MYFHPNQILKVKITQFSETESNPRYLSLIRKHIIKLFCFEMISFFVTIFSDTFLGFA